MSLEIKTGYMTAAQLDELNQGKGLTVPTNNIQTISSDMPKIDVATMAANVGTQFTVTPTHPKKIVNEFGNDLQSILNANREPTNMTTASEGDSGVNQVLNAYRANKTRFLQETINLATMGNADQAAQIQLLSKEFGIPPSIVQSNLDELKRKSELMKIDFKTLQADSPILAEQLQNITFSSVAHDDLEPLGAIEGAFKFFKDGAVDAFTGVKNVPTGFSAGNASTDYGHLGFQVLSNGGVYSEVDLAEIKRLQELMAEKPDDSWLGDAGYVAGSFYQTLIDAGIVSSGTALSVAGATYLATLPYQGPAAFTPGPEDLVFGGGAAATGLFAAGPAFFTTLAGQSFRIEAGHSYLELRELGATHENASNIAFVVGSTNAALEMVGIKAITAPWRKGWQAFIQKKVTNAMTRKNLLGNVLGTYLASIGVETGTEVLQEITAIMGEEFAKMQDEGIDVESLLASEEGMEQLWHRLEEIFRTTARGMSILAIPGAAVHYNSGSAQVNQAEQTKQLFEALSHSAAGSNLIARLPEEAQEFVKAVTKDGDVDTVYIDHEKFQDYLNKRGIDPESDEAKTFFQDLGIDTQLPELAVTGGDVAIPIEIYTTNIAGTDHHYDLAPHIRVNQDHWSASESENWKKNNPDFTANLEAIEKEAERIRNLSDNERQTNIIYKEVFDQLVSQGTSREDSNVQAAMYSAVFEVLGKEGNIDSAELFKKYGLDIQRVFDGQNKVQPKKELIDVVEEVLEAKNPTPIIESKPEEFEPLPTLSSEAEKGTIPGDEIALEAQMLGTDVVLETSEEYGGFIKPTLDDIEKEDYTNTAINIEELIKNDENLKEYLDSEPGVREFEGEEFGMRPIVSSEGRVIDGYNRIAQAIADGATEINILQGQSQVKGKERKKFRSHDRDPYREFGDETTELPEKFKFVQPGSTLLIGKKRWDVKTINDFHHYITVEDDLGKERLIGFTQLELLNAQHVQQYGNDFRIIKGKLIEREVRGQYNISVGEGKARVQLPYAVEKDLIAALGDEARYYDIVEVDAPINERTGEPVTQAVKSKSVYKKQEKGFIAIAKWAKSTPTKPTTTEETKQEKVTAPKLKTLKKAELVKMAADLNIDVEENATKAILINRIKAAQSGEKQAPIEPVKPKVQGKLPVILYLIGKGGINPKSDLAGDLRSQDIKMPGLYRKATTATGVANQGYDNIPVEDFRAATGINPEEADGYVDVNWLFQRIVDEYAGDATLAEEDQAAMDAYERELAFYEEELTNFEKTTDDVNTELEDAQRADVDAMQYDMAEMTDFLENTLGIDLNESTPEEIEALIKEQLYDPQGRILDQAAFHGTGLAEFFDQFSTDFIGTGEGNQAYGWGLYFTSVKRIAEWYRDKDSGGFWTATLKDGTKIDSFNEDTLWVIAKADESDIRKTLLHRLLPPSNFFDPGSVIINESKVDQAIRNIEREIKEVKTRKSFVENALAFGALENAEKQWPDTMRYKETEKGLVIQINENNGMDGYWTDFTAPRPSRQEAVEYVRRTYDSTRNDDYLIDLEIAYKELLTVEGAEWNKGGQVYQVELAPKEEDYLMWDLGIEQQSDKVKKVIKKLKKELNIGVAGGMFTGASVYKQIGIALRGGFYNSEKVSKKLLEEGVRGVQFETGSTRSRDVEKEYNWVIFDDADVEITKVFNQEGIVVADNVAKYTNNRINRVIQQYQHPNQINASVVTINPADFVKAVTDPYYEAWLKDSFKVDDLDIERLSDEGQTPFVYVIEVFDSSDAVKGEWRIDGHEGRHRMQAMANAGITEAPLVVIFRDASWADKLTESGLGQSGSLLGAYEKDDYNPNTLKYTNVVDIFQNSAEELQEAHGTDQDAKIFFQNEPEPTLEELIEAKQYQGTHKAPSSGYGAPGHDVTDGMYPDDVYGLNGNRYYGDGSAAGEQAINHMRQMKGNPDFEITVYRAAPKDAKTINPGDWVTTVKSYADEHGWRQYDEGEYKVISKKVKASEIFTEGNSIFEWGYSPTERQSEFFQTVPIMDGREKLRKYGLDERKRNRNQDVALALQSRQRKKYGFIDFNDISKEAENKVAGWIAAEVRYKVRQIDDPNSAVGWYSIKFQKGLDTLGQRYPELISESGFKNSKFPGVRALENKQNARDFFALLVAMTSDGQKVKQNFALAAGIYDKFRKTGKVPETGTFGGERIASMLRNAKRINQMVEEKGFKGTRDFLLQVKTVGELNKIAAQEKLKFDSGFLVDTTLPMASVVIGDKLGTFYANLMGFDGYVTMDRWFSRTINRYRGDLLMNPTKIGLKRFREMINQPNLTDEETILATIEPARVYQKSKFKDKSPINKAANTIYKAAFGGLHDVPRNKSDRRFMQNVVSNARKRLKKTGIELTEADIQAILWYYEKQLYGELGAVASQEISYEEAADILVNNKKVVPGINVEGPGGQMTEIYDQDRGLKRGSIQFRNVGKRDQKTIISLFSAADNSTFLHESGHLFLQVMQDVAESAEASDAIKADWAATLKYLGVKSGEDIGVKEHEKWAESFEQYLFEGKAPTIEMQGPFRKFKAWLQSVYQQATGLGIEINDDIRGVFDRLLGTKDEIRLAQEQSEILALFDSPEVIGFDDKKWQEYLEAVKLANQEAEDDLDQKKLREVTRQNSKEYQRKIKEMELEVTKEAEAMPVYKAIHYLQNGEDIDTKQPLDGLENLKMHTKSLKDTFGPGILNKIPHRKKMHSKNGTHHEDVATVFGFESGLDMITQMQSAQPIKQFIKAQAAERVARDSGALSMNPQKLTEEAVKSIAGSKARGHLLKLQMEMTAKKAKTPGTPINVLHELARQLIANKQVSNIHLKQARLAENRAYKAAQKAILEENWFEANKQVTTQTLNYFIYREAEIALDKVEKSLTYLDRISKPKHAKKLDRDSIEAIYALLDKVDLRRTRGTFKQTVAEHLDKLKAEGIELPTAAQIQALMESKKTHWKDMTFAEFEVFVDSVKSIENVARYKRKILDQNEKIEFKQLVEELVLTARTENSEHLSENTGNWKIQDPDFVPSKLKSYFKGQGAFLATHDKMEFVFEMMDGDITNGVWWNTFFRRLADAEARETEMSEQFITKLTELFESKHTLSERRNWAKTVQTRKGKFNKENIISIALNWGNLENRKALLAGFDKTQKEWGITNEDIEAMLDQHMEAKDWELVQQVWDLINELWPDIAALQKRVTGLVPPKVEATSFKTRFGTLRGGYYPLSYDRDFNFIRDMGSTLFYESSENKNLYDKPSYAKAATKQGHVETRKKESGRLVRMDLGVLSEHMNNVIHDITHREAIFYMNRLMGNEDIKEAIAGVAGKEVLSLINPWIKRVANPRPPPYDPLEKVLNYANTSATMVAMGFKVTTALVQFFGYTQSIDYLGKGWAWQGLSSFYSNPIEAKKAIFERSSMMRTRTKSLDRDVREAIGSITAKDSRLKQVKSKYFYFIGMMDMYVSLPTWTGAYEKAIHEGMSEKDAIAQGDSAVRMTQSSGMIKDLAHIQGREETLFKMFTKFYSYFSAYWMMSRRTARLRRKGKISQLEAMEQFFWLTVLPATLAEALLGRGPNRDDDDDNDNLTGWSTWSLIQAMTFRFNGMVLIRDAKNAIMNPQFGMGSPWQDLFDYGAKIPESMMDIMTGEDTPTDWKNLLLGISYIVQLPGRQVANMYDHLVEIFDEGEDFNFYELMVSVNRND